MPLLPHGLPVASVAKHKAGEAIQPRTCNDAAKARVHLLLDSNAIKAPRPSQSVERLEIGYVRFGPIADSTCRLYSTVTRCLDLDQIERPLCMFSSRALRGIRTGGGRCPTVSSRTAPATSLQA